jgi:hypothetical protein
MLERRTISEHDVVAAFQHAGLPLRPFTSSGAVQQFTASSGKLVPAVVVSVFHTEQAAKHSESSLAINGKRVRAIGMRNVRIFVAAGAPQDLRRQVTHVLALLRRVR